MEARGLPARLAFPLLWLSHGRAQSRGGRATVVAARVRQPHARQARCAAGLRSRKMNVVVAAAITNSEGSMDEEEDEHGELRLSSEAMDPLWRYIAMIGGKRSIRRILISANGLAAIKGMVSMRQWAAVQLGDTQALTFVVMATPEDIAANAAFVLHADVVVEVTGGHNFNNYANVNLIVTTAVSHRVDAVWPGWGHASENPKLPQLLQEHGVSFIGPPSRVMHLLGDKIASILLAQSAGVPCIPWSGDGLTTELTAEGRVPGEVYVRGMVSTVERALEEAQRIGYPVMLKASEGGGGKGIRTSHSPQEVPSHFHQVRAEVPGSPVFVMKHMVGVRHLEVQIVGDEYGNCAALSGRDCSTQRRFQKLIEEGPPTVAPPAVWEEMQRAAQALTKSIGYVGAGTVEFMFEPATNGFYFLELNPRLQVEHPVTEGLTGINLPSVILQTAMGVPLQRIPDVRRFFGAMDETDVVDFDGPLPAVNTHVIAARITAENPDDGFKPCGGRVDRISIDQWSQAVWSYFSMGTECAGNVHEFADSQLGHVFATAATRDAARRTLVAALRTLMVRGQVRCTTETIISLLESPEFRTDKHDTAWLDTLIELDSHTLRGGGPTLSPRIDTDVATAAAAPSSYPTPVAPPREWAAGKLTQHLHPHTVVLLGALVRAHLRRKAADKRLRIALGKGQVPTIPADLLQHEVAIIYEDTKYHFEVTWLGQTNVQLRSLQSRPGIEDQRVLARVRSMDGILSVAFEGQQFQVEAMDDSLGLRMHVESAAHGMVTCIIPSERDPRELLAPVTGKLIRYQLSSGALVEAGQAYAEMESMKMVLPLLAAHTGVVHHSIAAGEMVEAGALVATMELTQPQAANKVISDFDGPLLMEGDGTPAAVSPSAAPAQQELQAFETALGEATSLLQGYPLDPEEVTQRLLDALADPGLIRNALQLGAAASGNKLPTALEPLLDGEVSMTPEEVIEVLRIDQPRGGKRGADDSVASGRFPPTLGSTTSVDPVLQPLLDQCEKFNGGLWPHALDVLCTLVERYAAVESQFDGLAYDRAVQQMLQQQPGDADNTDAVYAALLSHAQLTRTSVLMDSLLRRLPSIARRCHVDSDRCLAKCWRCLGHLLPCRLEVAIGHLSRLTHPEHAAVALTAATILMERSTPTPGERIAALREYVQFVGRQEAAAGESWTLPVEPYMPSAGSALRESLANAEALVFSRAATWGRVAHTPAESRGGDDESGVGGSDFNLYQPFNEHDHIAMWCATVSGLHAAASLPERFGRSVSDDAEERKLPIWRGGAESLEAQRGLVASILELLPVLFNDPDFTVRATAAKMYIRHVYSDYDIEELMVRIDEAELPSLDVTLRQELQRECCMLVHFSYTQRCVPAATRQSCDGVVVVKMDAQASVQSSTIQTALDHLQDRRQARYLGQSEEGDSVMLDPANSILVVQLVGCAPGKLGTPEFETEEEKALQQTQEALNGLQTQLTEQRVRQVSLLCMPFCPLGQGLTHSIEVSDLSDDDTLHRSVPVYQTFWADQGFQLDPSTLGEEPSFSHYLALNRFAGCQLERLPCLHRDTRLLIARRHGVERAMLLYRRVSYITDLVEGSPPPPTLTPTATAATLPGPRRAHTGGTATTPLERMLDQALSELELAMLDNRAARSSSTHVYINALHPISAPLEAQGKAPWAERVALRLTDQLTEYVGARAARLLTLRLDEIEVRVRLMPMAATAGGGERPLHSMCAIPLRLLASSMGGQWLQVEAFQEKLDPVTGEPTLLCKPGSSLSHDGVVSCPESMQASNTQANWDRIEGKRALARNQHTIYCYDLPALMEKELVREACSGGTLQQVWRKHLLTADELLMTPQGDSPVGTLKRMEGAQRPIGTNDVGMVGWHCQLVTPQYPQGRELVLVANDCTFKRGSFATREDHFFAAAAEYAVERGLPFIYCTCNAGARLGLADELKDLIRVEWNNPDQPSLGFRYLYLTPEDYDALPAGCVHVHEQMGANGDTQCVIDHIVGSTRDIGVENLRGSGMIAGIMSWAYTKTFTLSYVTGQSVGIGAYLNRLSQRVIQKEGSPLILTGFAALNKLLGRAVYQTHDQLGGTQVMHTNGVTHLTVQDDQQGMVEILRWLSFIPPTAASPPHMASCVDPVDRPVGFVPAPGAEYDPRWLLVGCGHNAGERASGQAPLDGLFDAGSFHETLAGWARTVVVGRARLGGLPCGVIAVETRTLTLTVPADPADDTSVTQTRSQAGQVWYPDSAHKTAQTIRDLNHEGLPLFILANWRGFSGGTRDMLDQVLKFGAAIVNELRQYRHPVFVYLPPGAEVRGGAWVVLDTMINARCIEMYADPTSRAGILEPEGTVHVKFGVRDQRKLMARLDPVLRKLDPKDPSDAVEMHQRHEALLPTYLSVAHTFADLHDRSGRMLAKGVIRAEVEWPNSRPFFFWRLRRRLAERALLEVMQRSSMPTDASDDAVMRAVRQAYVSVSKRRTLDDWERDDEGVWAWLDAATDDVQLQNRLRAWVERWTAKERLSVSEAGEAGVPLPSDFTTGDLSERPTEEPPRWDAPESP